MSETLKLILLLFVMAGVTYAVRAIPLILFRNKIRSVYLRSFLKYVPYAVLSAMTFPYVFYSTGNVYAAFSATVVAVVAAVFKLSLTVVALLACVSAFVLIIVL